MGGEHKTLNSVEIFFGYFNFRESCLDFLAIFSHDSAFPTCISTLQFPPQHNYFFTFFANTKQNMLINHEFFMRKALQEAQAAFDIDEVPVGAIVVVKDQIVSRGHNMVEKLSDPTAHAEMIALTSAFAACGKYLPEATLYVTLEPCHQCAGALYWSKIGRVVYGASDAKHGFQHFYGNNNPFHPKTEILHGILADECAELMKAFFKSKRLGS
jgi:tRNA(adenine34) deaminase